MWGRLTQIQHAIITCSKGVPSGKDHLGSIRVVLNSTNQVISAQDYDAWGYPLENRTYNATAMKYDFTGKERDDQTTYDYFGARYYDSRIGRWGGVEPLLDKYIGITPYCFSLNNPIVLKDPNGKDPRITIDGNNITFEAEILYNTDPTDPYSFNDETMSILTDLKESAEDWNEVGQSIEIDGNVYNIEFHVYLTEVSSQVFHNQGNVPIGVNLAKFMKSGSHMDVINGNMLELRDPNELAKEQYELPQNWNAHELGHVFGFKDKYPRGDSRQKFSENIMGAHSKHRKPTKKDVIKLIKGLGIKLSNKRHSEVAKGGTVQP